MLFILLCLYFYNCQPLVSNHIVPKKLWGKKIILNGPIKTDDYFSPFDGKGHITSVVFNENQTIISEVHIPSIENEMIFPLSDFFKRNYISLLSKLPYTMFKNEIVQSCTRNTAVLNFNKTYYAVEESCSPIKLNYTEKGILKLNIDKSKIPLMAAHMADNYTMFSYNPMKKQPLALNTTIPLPWIPSKYPFLVHDCKRINERFFIFPLMSSGLGKFCDYIKKEINVPLDDKHNKAGWLLYDSKNNSCHELRLEEYADLFHIAHIEHIYKGVYKIYAPFVYNFPLWVSGLGKLDIRLKESIIDIDKKTVLQTIDTNLNLDFLHKVGDELIGSCLEEKPSIIKYNMVTKQHTRINLNGGIVRAINPCGDYLLYFSHETNNSYLYIANITNGETINKIEVPHRLPGFHTTLFD